MSIPDQLLKLIKLKKRIHCILTKKHLPELKKTQNALQRKIKQGIRDLKSTNLKTNFLQLESFKCSTAKHWKVLNALGDPHQDKRTQSFFVDNNTIIDEEQKIAESFALHLNDIFGTPTQINIDPEPPDTPTTPASTAETITPDEIIQALSTCKASGAPGTDNITNNMLKKSPPNILARLSEIFNASLNLSHLPPAWKKSKIKMIHKQKKPKDHFNSYRPISLISCISKLMEKLMNSRILSWAEENSVLPPCQSGFRKGRSCQDHIARLDQIITEGFNKKQLTGCVLFDLEKAFDKASHEGIIHRLTKFNLPSHLLDWVKSFLTDRTFHVTWRTSTSSTFTTKTGVPQGSCLSPTLFNIFFSDISVHIPRHIHRALYADDLGILYRSTKLREIQSNLQTTINEINTFCTKWGLAINKSKTTYTVFTPAGKRKNYERSYKLNLTINGALIPLDPFPTFLGIKLDPKLSYQQHLEYISGKIMSRTRLIRKIVSLKLKNSRELSLIVFRSQIRSLLDYAFIPTISPCQTIAAKLQTLQNRVLRTIKHFPLKTSTRHIHEHFNLELVKHRAFSTARRFAMSRQHHEQLRSDYNDFVKSRTTGTPNKHKTVFETMIGLTPDIHHPKTTQ
jgi:hypothetical protein